MKKFIAVLAVLMMLVGCSNTNTGKTDDSKMAKVGILQLATHDALDQSRLGFMDALKDGGFIEGENLEIEYLNPEGDLNNLSTMAESILSDSPELVLAIATNPAQALQNVNYDTPILATAVTDFVASGLAESNEVPGGMIAGVSDGCAMADQLALLLEAVPTVKRLGIIYTSSEPNSEIQAKQMIAECEKNSVEAIVATVSDKTMIDDTLQSFTGKVDAIYVPTDNNIASAMASVEIYASEKKLPVLCGEANIVRNGGLLSLGVDYYKIGYQTGEMAVALLKGEKTINDLQIETQKDISVFYNSKTAEKIGLTMVDSITGRGVDVTTE